MFAPNQPNAPGVESQVRDGVAQEVDAVQQLMDLLGQLVDQFVLVEVLAASNMYAETLAHVVLSDAAELRQLIEALHAHAKDALARGYALCDALAVGQLPE
jgi:hypothetical protein